MCSQDVRLLGGHRQDGLPTVWLRPARGFFREPPGLRQESPGMQFKGGSRGFHGAFSLPDHLNQGVFWLVFCIG